MLKITLSISYFRAQIILILVYNREFATGTTNSGNIIYACISNVRIKSAIIVINLFNCIQNY
jgi:hypothetical protein